MHTFLPSLRVLLLISNPYFYLFLRGIKVQPSEGRLCGIKEEVTRASGGLVDGDGARREMFFFPLHSGIFMWNKRMGVLGFGGLGKHC